MFGLRPHLLVSYLTNPTFAFAAGSNAGSIKARFENMAKQKEDEDRKRAEEERLRRQAKEKQEQEEAQRKMEESARGPSPTPPVQPSAAATYQVSPAEGGGQEPEPAPRPERVQFVSLQNREEPEAAEENGEQLYEVEAENRSTEPEALYLAPDETTAAGEPWILTFDPCSSVILKPADGDEQSHPD